ncbi:ABC transporter permease subunit [Peptostreptococcus faecalis]|uniref:ABC transporter permease subunit n=1 Tax=Peptostreptococcus faecalis TaxID=2045015 RepID=UPI000C79850E|nr:ABC transporter permease subunit [Peptostreptococcus faecalis]
MRKLIYANLVRIMINKIFWIMFFIISIFEVIACFKLSANSTPIEFTLFITFQVISIVIAIYFSLFLGTEYSDGTVRNKIIIGHKRENIYFANLITGILSITIMYILIILVGLIMGLLLGGEFNYSIEKILAAGIVIWFACISYISIFNLVGMISLSKANSSIISLLISFFTIFFGIYVTNKLSSPKLNKIYVFLYEFNPWGQILEGIKINMESPWKLISYAILLSIITTVVGLIIFRKKDLK